MADAPGARGLMLAAVALTLLAIVVGAQFFLDDSEPQPDSGDQPSPSAAAPSPDVESAPPPGPTSDRDGQGNQDGEPTTPPESGPSAAAIDAASDGVEAYTEYSYTDPSFNSWQDRLARVSTAAFIDSLRDTFDNDASIRTYWRTAVLAEERQTRTEVEDLAVEDFLFEVTRNQVTFTVRYRTEMTSNETQGWEPRDAPDLWVTVVRFEDRWLVNDIRVAGDERP